MEISIETPEYATFFNGLFRSLFRIFLLFMYTELKNMELF